MGWSIRRSFGLGKGLRINLSKSGAGLSLGIPGFRVGVGPKGVRREVSVPGTGIFNRKQTGWKKLRGGDGDAILPGGGKSSKGDQPVLLESLPTGKPSIMPAEDLEPEVLDAEIVEEAGGEQVPPDASNTRAPGEVPQEKITSWREMAKKLAASDDLRQRVDHFLRRADKRTERIIRDVMRREGPVAAQSSGGDSLSQEDSGWVAERFLEAFALKLDTIEIDCAAGRRARWGKYAPLVLSWGAAVLIACVALIQPYPGGQGGFSFTVSHPILSLAASFFAAGCLGEYSRQGFWSGVSDALLPVTFAVSFSAGFYSDQTAGIFMFITYPVTCLLPAVASVMSVTSYYEFSIRKAATYAWMPPFIALAVGVGFLAVATIQEGSDALGGAAILAVLLVVVVGLVWGVSLPFLRAFVLEKQGDDEAARKSFSAGVQGAVGAAVGIAAGAYLSKRKDRSNKTK